MPATIALSSPRARTSKHQEARHDLRAPAFEAIAHAHSEGVAHRDIKPANILIEGILAGVRHEPVGTGEVTFPPIPIPNRLSLSKGPEVATRVNAIGGDVILDDIDVSTKVTMVGVTFEGATGSLMLIEGPSR